MQFLLVLLNKLLAIFHTGGILMIPLVLCSIMTTALILEQYWYSLLSDRRLKKLWQTPEQFKQMEGMDMIARAMFWLRQHQQSSLEEQTQGMDLIYHHFERRINWLNTLAAVAPLLGLLGTVSGMIRIFSVVSTEKPTNAIASLSGGISEALFATGGGLLVAILAALFYHYLNNRLEAMGEQLRVWYGSQYLSLKNHEG